MSSKFKYVRLSFERDAYLPPPEFPIPPLLSPLDCFIFLASQPAILHFSLNLFPTCPSSIHHDSLNLLCLLRLLCLPFAVAPHFLLSVCHSRGHDGAFDVRGHQVSCVCCRWFDSRSHAFFFSKLCLLAANALKRRSTTFSTSIRNAARGLRNRLQRRRE